MTQYVQLLREQSRLQSSFCVGRENCHFGWDSHRGRMKPVKRSLEEGKLRARGEERRVGGT